MRLLLYCLGSSIHWAIKGQGKRLNQPIVANAGILCVLNASHFPKDMTMSLYLMSALYTLAGIMHFVMPRFYRRIIPPSLPFPDLLVWLSGLAEIILGVGLLTAFSTWAAWGIILMLLVFLPVHAYMLTSTKFAKIPRWLLWLRIPLQLVLMAWAYQHTR